MFLYPQFPFAVCGRPYDYGFKSRKPVLFLAICGLRILRIGHYASRQSHPDKLS